MKQFIGFLIVVVSLITFFGWIFIGASMCPELAGKETQFGLNQHDWMTFIMVGWGILFIICAAAMGVGANMIHEHAGTVMGILGLYLLFKGDDEDE